MTVIVMLLTILVIIAYDVFALVFLGRDKTISARLNQWSQQASPSLLILFGFALGILFNHFFGRWEP